MSSNLPINLADLLRQRTAEDDRIEYKAGWKVIDQGMSDKPDAKTMELAGG